MSTKPDAALAEIATRQHGIVSLADARAAGLTHGQIDARVRDRWTVVHQGVFRLPGVPATWRGDLYAACAAASNPSATSHRSAAALYGLPGGRPDLVEISCRRWLRTQRPGLVVHESTRFDERDITVIDGIRVVTVERLALELAGLWPSPNFVETVLQAARRKRLLTYESTQETFGRLARRGVRGVQAMRLALERWQELRQPTESDMETKLLQILREHGLPEPITQFVVRDEAGNFVARTDLGFSEWPIVVEYESMQEHTDEFQRLRDDHRRNAIMAAGYWPLSARCADISNGGHVLVGEIRRLAQRLAS